MDTVKNSSLYRELSAARKGVEIWEDNFVDGDWKHYSIVAFAKGEADILANVRTKVGVIEKRTTAGGEETWVTVE